MKKINFHTHTNRCRHADGIAADYVQSALSAGVTQLGFSDHAPFPDYDFGMRMPYCELSEYIEDINALTVQYRTDIILWKGLEIEYLPEYRDYYEALLTRSGMDYLLMGEHFYKNASGKTTNYTDALSTDEFPVYAQNVADGMKTGLFLAVAHPDIYMADNFVWDDNCKKAADIIIDTAVTTGTVLEYNANGFRREKKFYPDGTRYQYPHPAFWEMVKGSGARVIVGSDCHNPSQVWDVAIEKAYQNLYALGIHPISSLFDTSDVPSALHTTRNIHEYQRYCQIGERDTGNCFQSFKQLSRYQRSYKTTRTTDHKRESVHHKKRRQKVQTGCYTTYWTCLGKCLQLGFRDNAEPAFRALSQRRLYCFILSG